MARLFCSAESLLGDPLGESHHIHMRFSCWSLMINGRPVNVSCKLVQDDDSEPCILEKCSIKAIDVDTISKCGDFLLWIVTVSKRNFTKALCKSNIIGQPLCAK